MREAATRDPFPREGALLVVLAAVIAASPWHFGYYEPTTWAPAGLVLFAVVMAVAIVRPARLTIPGATALAALFSLAAWSLISSTWGDSAHEAFLAGDRLLVYGALLAIVLMLVRDARSGAILLSAAGVGVLALVGDEYIRLASSDPAAAFVGGRLNAPLGYVNGLGTYFILGLWVAVAGAEQRRWPWLAGLSIAAASLIATLLLLSQSRGVALAVCIAALTMLAVVPGRLRRAGVYLLLGAGVAVMLGSTNAVYRAGQQDRLTEAVTDRLVERAVLVALALGTLWALAVAALEHARRRAPHVASGARSVARAALAAGCLVAVVVAVASAGAITDEVNTQYHAFVDLGQQPSSQATSSRLLSGAGNRNDYWRIALRVWRENPIAGVGAGGYPVPYFRQRATGEDIRQPHSIQLQTLSELGVVGGLLLVTFLGAVLFTGLQGAVRARSSALERFVVVAGLGMFVSWLVHTSVDWIHLLPGVTAVALCAAGVLLRPAGPSTALLPSAIAGRWARIALLAFAMLALLGAGTLLSRQALAERHAAKAQDELAARPEASLRDADRALRLDPDFVSAHYTRAAALARQGDAGGAERSLQDALRAEPDNFVTWGLLGDLYVRTGNLSAARRRYARASRLNPRDPRLAALARNPRPAAATP